MRRSPILRRPVCSAGASARGPRVKPMTGDAAILAGRRDGKAGAAPDAVR